jgi:CheY-like chemotaxis protein
MALSDISEDNPMAEYLNAIMQAAERSSDITRQLLAFARKQTINPKILDINVCIEKMLSMLQNLIGENIDLSWCPQQEIWPVKMDSAQVDQLLTNLCLNARDAVLDIGKITIETAAVSFDTDYCKDHAGFIPGDYVMLAVTDTGQGIDKKILPYLFEPFFTTKQLGRGTGLGLATVYGIVKQNKGFINVYSEPGKGTIFKIYLSRHYTNAPVNEQVISIKAAAKGKGQKILVLEDENTMLKIITRMVKSLGYSPISADRPNRAIEIARSYRQKESPESKIDLLITDVVMPEMNGRDLANQIKSIFPDIKIIFMSGYTENVIAHQGILDENINFIQKPFNTSCLARTIEDVLFNK